MKQFALDFINQKSNYRNSLIGACNTLINQYQNEEGMIFCPLCDVASDMRTMLWSHIIHCEICPWLAYNGRKCSQVMPNISCIRSEPDRYPQQAKNRIRTLKRWIKRMEAIT